MRARQQQKEEVYKMDKIIKIGFALMTLIMMLGMIGEENENDKVTYRNMCVFFAMATAVMVIM